jgi:hypothetical protein
MFTNLARRTGAALLAAALTVLLPARGAAADDPLVKAVAVPEQVLRDDGKHPEYRFALTLAEGVDAGGLKAYVLRVTARGHADAGLVPAFSPEVKEVPDLGPALVVGVDFDLAAAPVTYEIEVALSGSKQHAAVKQSVVVRLIHAAAQVRLPARLLLSRSWFFAPLGQFPNALTVEETSRSSRLTGLLAMQVPPALHDDEPVDGQIALKPPAAIEPGAVAALPLSFEGSFPVGITRGKIEVRASQLEAPHLVDYELKVRMPTWVIPLLFLAGAGIGYLVRIRLKTREERLTRTLRARELCERLGHLEERSSPEDQVTLWNMVKEIADHEEGGEEFEAAMKKAEEQLAALLEARATAQRTIVAEAGRAAAALGRGWTLPATMELAPLSKAFTEAQRKAVADDLLGALAARAEAAERIRALARAARVWATSVERHLVKLEEAKPPADLATAAGELRAALAKIPGEDAEPALEPLLHGVHASNTIALALVERVANALADAAEEACRAAPNHADAIHEAVRMGDGKAAPVEAEEAMAHLADTVRRLHDAVSKVVLELMPSGSADRAAVQGLHDERRYGEALERAKAAAEPALVAAFSDDGDEPGAAPQAAQRRLPALSTRGPAPAVAGETSVIMLATPGAGARGGRADVRRQLSETKATLMILSATIMSLLTWALYAREFFGTSREIVSLFALGFTTDVSADALFAALSKAKKA